MRKNTNLKPKRVLLSICAALVIGGLVITLPRLLIRHADLRSRMAQALNVPDTQAANFFINLPPAATRYPGTILATDSLFVLNPADANDADLHTGGSFHLTADDQAAGDALGSLGVPWLNEASSSKQEVGIELEITGGKVLEMDVSALKRKLLASKEAQSAANKGTDPIIVTKAYLGQITYVLKQKGKDQGSVWNKIKESKADSEQFKIDVSHVDQGEVRVEMQNPIIFAFEASSAHFILSHLGVEPTDVQLTPVIPRQHQAQNALKVLSATHGPKWTLVTIASGHYPNLQMLRQDWNAESAAVFDATFSNYAPVANLQLASSEEKPITEEGLRAFCDTVAATVRGNHSEFVIAYYVGHTVTWPSGDMALILGSASQMPVSAAPQSHADDSLALGKNIEDLSRLANALSANVETLPKGYFPLRELYAKLEKNQVPFALLVDGCLRMDEFERMRSALGIASDKQLRTFFYIGPDGGEASSVDGLAGLLTHAADNQPFLHSANPVVLAAKPGTYAYSRQDPDNAWTDVGPLAAREVNLFRASRYDESPPTLADLVVRITDYRGTGEISPTGSISWSDFSRFNALAGSAAYPGR